MILRVKLLNTSVGNGESWFAISDYDKARLLETIVSNPSSDYSVVVVSDSPETYEFKQHEKNAGLFAVLKVQRIAPLLRAKSGEQICNPTYHVKTDRDKARVMETIVATSIGKTKVVFTDEEYREDTWFEL